MNHVGCGEQPTILCWFLAVGAASIEYPELQVQLTLSDRFIDPLEEGFDVTVRIAGTSAAHALTESITL